MDGSGIDALRVSAGDLARLLDARKITSEEVVEAYLEQIERHNHQGLNLRALISVAAKQELLDRAHALDIERIEKGSRGPLHGIPIIVKDVFHTPSLSLPTTCGAASLKTAFGNKDAATIEILLNAGAIIIGKGNLSELGGMKGEACPAGWSALGGQTQPPYVWGGILPDAALLGHSTPAGSSAGPAVGVAAGFAALALATETDGSTVQPATRAGLYGLKATLGSVPLEGSQPISPAFDCAGVMAKTAADLASMLAVLHSKSYEGELTGSWEGIRVGFVDPERWQPAPWVVEVVEEFRIQSDATYQNATKRIQAAGAGIIVNVLIPTLSEIFEDCPDGISDIDQLPDADFRTNINAFLSTYSPSSTPVHSLADMISWNKRHPPEALPPEAPQQNYLIAAEADRTPRASFTSALQYVRDRARTQISKTMQESGVDVVFAPADGRMASVAACAGWPVGSCPLGFAEFNGRGFGVSLLALGGDEGKILRVMSAWEGMMGQREVPEMLRDEGMTSI